MPLNDAERPDNIIPRWQTVSNKAKAGIEMLYVMTPATRRRASQGSQFSAFFRRLTQTYNNKLTNPNLTQPKITYPNFAQRTQDNQRQDQTETNLTQINVTKFNPT